MEDQLIEGCKKGKRQSFEQLYRKYSATMLGMCFRYCSSKDEAEDVVQEGFIKVFQKIGTYKGSGSFEGWIKRIMINTAINTYKTNSRFPFTEEINDRLIVDDSDQIIEMDDGIKSETLMKIIRDLPKGYKVVFNMYAIDGLTHKEIADNLGISVSTSKSQLFKARRWLRNKLIDNKIIEQ